jgi:uncharacterized integral membrane protein
MGDELSASDNSATQPAVMSSGNEPPNPSSAGPTGRTRLSGAWVGVVVGVVLLAFLLAFIIQNTKSVKVSVFTLSGNMPLGVALLLAAIGGVLVAATVASLRIWQLRHRPHRSRRTADPQPP